MSDSPAATLTSTPGDLAGFGLVYPDSQWRYLVQFFRLRWHDWHVRSGADPSPERKRKAGWYPVQVSGSLGNDGAYWAQPRYLVEIGPRTDFATLTLSYHGADNGEKLSDEGD